jgi:SAM-dependent methyltransferase
MSPGWREWDRCALCGGREFADLYTAPDRHYGIAGCFKIVRCGRCGLVFLNPMPLEAELARMYPPSYYSYQDFLRPQNRLKRLAKRILVPRPATRDPEFPRPGRMLDLGCGSGAFLHHMRRNGWETHGVEISAEAARVGRERAGLDIFGGTLAEAAYPSDYFDYIRSNHSFEHLMNPGETLDEMRRVVKPGGKLLIGVPNIAGLNARIFKQYWWYLGAPVHPFNYSPRTLRGMVRKHGFVVDRVAYSGDYSGILGSLQIYLNRKSGRLSSQGLVVNNPALLWPAHGVARAMNALRLGDAIEITFHKGAGE